MNRVPNCGPPSQFLKNLLHIPPPVFPFLLGETSRIPSVGCSNAGGLDPLCWCHRLISKKTMSCLQTTDFTPKPSHFLARKKIKPHGFPCDEPVFCRTSVGTPFWFWFLVSQLLVVFAARLLNDFGNGSPDHLCSPLNPAVCHHFFSKTPENLGHPNLQRWIRKHSIGKALLCRF